jgi:sodium/hydrogen antiporter
MCGRVVFASAPSIAEVEETGKPSREMQVVLRPLSVVTAIIGERLTAPQSALITWFGIRGIGSLFYLLLALRHGVDARTADLLVPLTLWTIAASIIVHGLTAQPLMRRHAAQREGPSGASP